MRKDAFLTAGLLAACALVITLSVQNRLLHSRFEDFVSQTAQPEVGAWLPAVPVRDSAGASRMLGKAPTDLQVLYFFEPSCPHCRATAPTIRAMEAALTREHRPVELIGLSRAPNAERDAYAHDQHFDFPMVASTSRIGSLFRVRAVPLVIVADRRGRVIYAHGGELNTKDEVQHLMTVVRSTEAMPAVASIQE